MEFPFLPVCRWESTLLPQQVFYGSQVRWGLSEDKTLHIHEKDLVDARMLAVDHARRNNENTDALMFADFVGEAHICARDLDWSDPGKVMPRYIHRMKGGEPDLPMMHRGQEVALKKEPKPKLRLIKGGKNAAKGP